MTACRLLLEAAEAGRLRAVHIVGNYGGGGGDFRRVTIAGDWKDAVLMLGAAALLFRHASDLAMECATGAEAEAANQEEG